MVVVNDYYDGDKEYHMVRRMVQIMVKTIRVDMNGEVAFVCCCDSGGRGGRRVAGNSNSARQQVEKFGEIPPVPRVIFSHIMNDHHHDEASSPRSKKEHDEAAADTPKRGPLLSSLLRSFISQV